MGTGVRQAVEDVFATLRGHAEALARIRIEELFETDPDRLSAFTVDEADLHCDLSKTLLTRAAKDDLLRLAGVAGVKAMRERMFTGGRINITENRAALHTALRIQPGESVRLDGVDLAEGILAERQRCMGFADAVRMGTVVGHTGQAFSDVVNIGIGGSHLGPAMVVRALSPYADGPRVHFVSNVDGADLGDVLARLDPHRTLFIVASKTFSTIETMTNAATARNWIAGAVGDDGAHAHFVALSSNRAATARFGVRAERVFPFADWVGGRYSVWSSIGLAAMIAIGPDNFSAFLAGGRAMDRHFRDAPLVRNMPVLAALIGIWHRNVLGYATRAVIPYDHRLSLLPAYLQQLEMESNGKSVTLDGTECPCLTAPVVWGEPGTNGQHAFFQHLHQGSDITPVDFLVAARSHEAGMDRHHAILVANCFAQGQALMCGRRHDKPVRVPASTTGSSGFDGQSLARHRAFPGNRPSVTLMYRMLDPHTLGRLISLYEHRTFVQAVIWDINPFDQWGVELGKELASKLVPAVSGAEPPEGADPSTYDLVQRFRRLAKA